MALGIVDHFRSSPVLGDLMSSCPSPSQSSSSRLWCLVNLYETLAECDRVSSKADFGMPFASFGMKKQTPLSTKALGQKLLKLLRGWSLSAPPPG